MAAPYILFLKNADLNFAGENFSAFCWKFEKVSRLEEGA